MRTAVDFPSRCLVRAALCACAVAACTQLAVADAPARANVVLIVLDDLGAMDLGCYGSKFYRTPAIDRLAADGMRFTQAYAACPVCSPTRAALMTGKYPARLHLTDCIPGNRNFARHRMLRPEFRQELPLEETTIAERLHAAGYATAQIGKWHLGGVGFEPVRQGFDLAIAGDAAGTPRSYFAPYVGRDGQAIPGLESAPPEEYLTDRLTSEAEKFIEQNRARPFFLYLPHFAVHTPLTAKADMIAKYEAAEKPPGRQTNPIYAAMIESVDESVGRIVAKLDALKLADNTIVIFTSDNGGLATVEGPHTPATNNAPLREGKGYLYEGGIRVPLIVKWPGHVQPGSTSAERVSSIDLPLTIADACGVPFDKASETAIDGVTLLDVLQNGGRLAERPLYWHYPHYSNQGGRPGGAVRRGDYKLIEFYEDGRLELFDLAKDASESTNLVDQQPDRAKQMAARPGRLAQGGRRPDARAESRTTSPTRRPTTARHAAGHDRRRARRDDSLRAAAAQEHDRLLDAPRRLGELGIRNRATRPLRDRNPARLRHRQRRQPGRFFRRRSDRHHHGRRDRRLSEICRAADRRDRAGPRRPLHAFGQAAQQAGAGRDGSAASAALGS